MCYELTPALFTFEHMTPIFSFLTVFLLVGMLIVSQKTCECLKLWFNVEVITLDEYGLIFSDKINKQMNTTYEYTRTMHLTTFVCTCV